MNHVTRHRTGVLSGSLTAAIFFFAFLWASSAHADFRICVVGSILTTDSGDSIPNGPNAGDTEDYWVNGDAGILKAIPGIWVEVTYSGGLWTGQYADHAGCADFYGSDTNATVTVRSRTQRGGGNQIVMHDDPSDFAQPSATWGYVYTGQTLASGTTSTYTVGAGIAKWTALFVANFTVGAWKSQLSGTTIYLGIDESCTMETEDIASAHFGDSNAQITNGRHYLWLANCGTTLLSRQKFTVSHEVGHAIAALFFGTSSGGANGHEPSSFDYSRDGDSPNSAYCRHVTAYQMWTKEWNAVAFREGYAHFVAAAAWNDRNDPGLAGQQGTGQEGSFTWNGATWDLERYLNGAGTGSGGRMENRCCEYSSNPDCLAAWDSSAVIEDWMLFLWDFYTEKNCNANPGLYTMLNIYRETRRNGNLTKGNYYTRSRQAMEELYSDSCLRNAFYSWANWNGVNHDT